MYTEKSAALKNDFYSRYGEMSGELYFERIGLPCVLLEGTERKLAFALGCGIRAYGRRMGDVLRILDADSDTCRVHFMQNGMGAQILYKADIADLKNMDMLRSYTIEKLLRRMGILTEMTDNQSDEALCDNYGSRGWCMMKCEGGVRQLPFPLNDYNVLLIRTQKKGGIIHDKDLTARFRAGENERIGAAADGLKKCRIDVLFDMVNESQRAIERLLKPKTHAVYAACIAAETDGVAAARISNAGVVCFVKKENTDSAAHMISVEYEKQLGFAPGIIVVK